jgi:quercetin dioxygenase-like cupin family protein
MDLRSTKNVSEDPTITGRPGWEGLHVWWLVNQEQTGARTMVVNITDFPPHKRHEMHRHPNAEEALYIVSGAGLHLSEGEPLRQRAGDVMYIPAGEWHGFENDTDDPTVLLALFGGVGSYEAAGYEIHPSESHD